MPQKYIGASHFGAGGLRYYLAAFLALAINSLTPLRAAIPLPTIFCDSDKMTDSVAQKSTYLCAYMSKHPDELVALLEHFGKVSEPVATPWMTSIDSKGMSLKYKGKNGPKSDVRVSFNPPLLGYEEVKPRLSAMTAEAQEALGMTKVPQIATFDLPATAIGSVMPPLCLLYITLSAQFTGSIWGPGRLIFNNIGGSTAGKVFWAVFTVLHIYECLHVSRTCAKHRTGFLVGIKYVLSTFVFGFPIPNHLQQKIQQARIDSITKNI